MRYSIFKGSIVFVSCRLASLGIRVWDWHVVFNEKHAEVCLLDGAFRVSFYVINADFLYL